MKTTRTFLGFIAACFLAVVFVAFGQIASPLPLPVSWATYDNAHSFGLSRTAIPTIRAADVAIAGVGTNNFSGITTNLDLMVVGGGSNKLAIVNGIIVGAPGL